MAIYHFSAQIIGRSDGRSSVAAAAYRSGETLLDERTGTECRYDRRQERIAHVEIIAPSDAPTWATDRQTLWNRVEAVEKRKDAQLAREFEASLPIELDLPDQLAVVRGFVADQLLSHGLAADLSVHVDPDRRNPHVHIMVPMRALTDTGFGGKLRDLNSRDQLATWREAWATHVNAGLKRAGLEERIDHRSLEAQGIVDLEPTIKEGYAARRMEAQGMASDRVAINRNIRARNAVKMRERLLAGFHRAQLLVRSLVPGRLPATASQLRAKLTLHRLLPIARNDLPFRAAIIAQRISSIKIRSSYVRPRQIPAFFAASENSPAASKSAGATTVRGVPKWELVPGLIARIARTEPTGLLVRSEEPRRVRADRDNPGLRPTNQPAPGLRPVSEQVRPAAGVVVPPSPSPAAAPNPRPPSSPTFVQRLGRALNAAGDTIYQMTPAARRIAADNAEAERRANAEHAAALQRARDEAEKKASEQLIQKTAELLVRLNRDTHARGEPFIHVSERLPNPASLPEHWSSEIRLGALTVDERSEYNRLAAMNPDLVYAVLSSYAYKLKTAAMEASLQSTYEETRALDRSVRSQPAHRDRQHVRPIEQPVDRQSTLAHTWRRQKDRGRD